MGMMKFAVTPGFEVGGTLFKPEQLALLGSIIGDNARVELTNFKQLYVEMEEERLEEVKRDLAETGLEVYPVGFVIRRSSPNLLDGFQLRNYAMRLPVKINRGKL